MTTVAPNLCKRVCSLTISHTQVNENGTYAVLFDGSGHNSTFGTRLPDELFTLSQSDLGDVCFSTDSAGTNQIACEIVWNTNGSKIAEIWVPVTLNTTSDVTIYVWYQSSAGTLSQPAASATYGSQAVWSTVGNVSGCWHFGSASSVSYNDSTSSANNGTNSGAAGGTGHIGGDVVFSTTGNVVTTSISLNGLTQLTIGGWFKRASSGALLYMSRSILAGGGTDTVSLGFYSDGNLYIDVGNNVNGYIASNDTNWHLVEILYNGGNATDATKMILMFDGVQQTLTWLASGVPTSIPTSSGTLQFGYRNSSSISSNGSEDEIRYQPSVTRSVNYSKTRYNIEASTSLITVGTPGSTGGSGTTPYQWWSNEELAGGLNTLGI